MGEKKDCLMVLMKAFVRDALMVSAKALLKGFVMVSELKEGSVLDLHSILLLFGCNMRCAGDLNVRMGRKVPTCPSNSCQTSFCNRATKGGSLADAHPISTCSCRHKFLEKDGNSPIGKDPFIILEQMDKYVSFKIKKQWNLTGPVYVQYFDPTHEQYYCVQSCDNATILAHCLTRVKIAIIEIWVETDNPFDNANISSCCFEDDYGGPPKGKYYVEGTYELWCDSKCDKE